MAEAIQSKYSSLETPKKPNVLETDQSFNSINDAKDQLAIVRDKFIWQCIREQTLESLRDAPPLETGSVESCANEISITATRIPERREFLNSCLRSLVATRNEALEVKESIAQKIKTLQANNEGRIARSKVPAFNTSVTLTEAANKFETETAINIKKNAELIEYNENLLLKIQGATKIRDNHIIEVEKLEMEVSEDVSLGDKRTNEMTLLVSKSKETDDSTQWFNYMTKVCDSLSGTKIMKINEINFPNSNKKMKKNKDKEDKEDVEPQTIIEVEILIFNRHTLTIKLGQNKEEEEAEDVILDAVLLTNFETQTLKESLANEKLAKQNKNKEDHEGGGWRNKIISGYVKTDGVINITDIIKLAKCLSSSSSSSTSYGHSRGHDIQLLVRECCARIASWPERCEHYAKLRHNRKYIVNPTDKGCFVSLPAGVSCSLRLSPDYPRSSGSVVVESLTGLENKTLLLLRDELNLTQWDTMDSLFDVLEARLNASGNSSS